MQMNFMNLWRKITMFNWVKNIINKIKREIQYRKRIKELKKRDPFIYK